MQRSEERPADQNRNSRRPRSRESVGTHDSLLGPRYPLSSEVFPRKSRQSTVDGRRRIIGSRAASFSLRPSKFFPKASRQNLGKPCSPSPSPAVRGERSMVWGLRFPPVRHAVKVKEVVKKPE